MLQPKGHSITLSRDDFQTVKTIELLELVDDHEVVYRRIHALRLHQAYKVKLIKPLRQNSSRYMSMRFKSCWPSHFPLSFRQLLYRGSARYAKRCAGECHRFLRIKLLGIELYNLMVSRLRHESG